MERISAVILSMLVVTGCASITRGTTEVFVIETTPANAQATLSTGHSCETPCSIIVPRRGDFVVTIEHDGYETVRSTISSNVDGDGAAGLAGNAIFGGFIGAGIDAGSGAMHAHQPNPLNVTLVPLGAASTDIATMEADEASVEEAEDLAGGRSPE